ncbi:MAG: PQQ-dependent sugar dehydrogenase [Pirellulales bacterium]
MHKHACLKNRDGRGGRWCRGLWLAAWAAFLWTGGPPVWLKADDEPSPTKDTPTQEAAEGKEKSPDKKAPLPVPQECRFTDGPINIDGLADEPAWSKAQVIDKFLLPWLSGDKARGPRTSTKARLLWDEENLYFTADMDDADLYADVTEHDGQCWDNDVFELFFKPADDKPGYYEFQVNAANTQLDMFIPRRGSGGYLRYRKDGDFHMESRVKLRGTLNRWNDRDQGWSVEGKIPWRDFLQCGGRPAIDEQWNFALCRYDYSVDFEGPDLSTTAATAQNPSADFHRYEDYGRLKFVGPLPENASRPHGISQLADLTTSTVVGSPEPPPPYKVARAYPDLTISFPIAVARQPDSDRLLFITQTKPYAPSAVHRMVDDPGVKEFETLWKPDATAYGITFHPEFAKNGYVFIGSNGNYGEKGPKKCRISRFTIDREPPYKFDVESEKVIIEWESDGHNGGDMAFGNDGMLYVTSGDGTSDSDTNITGQDLTKLLAKVLRIDVEHPDEGRLYSVPKDNPFRNLAGARPETWAYGFRNPWRITVDRKTGHVWVTQNGQDLWEQVYLVQRGANYGWSVMEGGHPFYLSRQVGPTPISKPTIDHPHSEARSLTGGVVYYGEKLPELRGAYIYGDYSTGKIWAVKHNGDRIEWHKELTDSPLAITGFGIDKHGELLIADHRDNDKGAFFHLEVNPTDDLPPSTFPRKLSESGLFSDVAQHAMQPGVIPYSVNSPLWSDGAHKERFMALPSKEGIDRKIDYTATRGWNLPEETVLVKSFALEMEQGQPDSRKWIETRFMTKQQGEWVGYSYIWNDEQTDAELVEAAGRDREFTIRVPESAEFPDGVRKQVWRYPSRAECMVCHSRAANYVLGLSTLQMNKDHDYHGVAENQLSLLSHLGLLRVKGSAELTTLLRDELKAQGLEDASVNARMATFTTAPGQRKPAEETSTLLPAAPERIPRLANPYDDAAGLTARARSYLHANCAHCHVDAGGGNAQINLEFAVSLDKMKLIDEPPLHHKFDLTEPRLIASGSPERSVLLHRVAKLGPGRMPQLATSVVDKQAVEMLRAWIKELGSGKR